MKIFILSPRMEAQEFGRDTQRGDVSQATEHRAYEHEMFSSSWLKPALGPHSEDLNAKRLAFHAGPCWIKILVADRVAGSVIGKGGKVITDIENSTGCIMKLSPGTFRSPHFCL